MHTMVAPSRRYWEKMKSRVCVCDRGYEGSDCSLRMCPRGDDPLTDCATARHANDVQELTFQGDDVMTTSGTPAVGFYTLKFTDLYNANFTTRPIATLATAAGAGTTKTRNLKALAADVEEALESLPNFAIPNVTVTAADVGSRVQFAVTFVDPANAGMQNLLECSYGSPMPTANKIDTDATTDNPYNYGASQPRFFSPAIGATAFEAKPRICTAAHATEVVAAAAARKMKESAVCSDRGTCDSATGLCTCFPGFTGEACSVQTTFM